MVLCLTQAQCAVVSASDGRWRAEDCLKQLPTACRKQQPWPAVLDSSLWQLAAGPRGTCPVGYLFEPPYDAAEGRALKASLQAAMQTGSNGADAAWLPIKGG